MFFLKREDGFFLEREDLPQLEVTAKKDLCYGLFIIEASLNFLRNTSSSNSVTTSVKDETKNGAQVLVTVTCDTKKVAQLNSFQHSIKRV